MATVWSSRAGDIAASTRVPRWQDCGWPQSVRRDNRRVAKLALSALALAYGAACAAVAFSAGALPTSYAAVSDGALAVDVAAGLGLIIAGSLVSTERGRGSIGPVTTLLGVVWLAPDLVGWEQGPAFVRSLAMLAEPFLLVLLVHLVLALPAGDSSRPRAASPSRRPTAQRPSSASAARCSEIPSLTCAAGATAPTTSSSSTPSPDLARSSDRSGSASPSSPASSSPRSPSGGCCVRRAAGRAALWAVLVPAALAATAQAAYAIALIARPGRGPRRRPSSRRSSLPARWRSPAWRPA